MKTLPAAITAGKGGDSERVILVRISPKLGDDWWMGELLWSTKGIVITDWEGGESSKTFYGNHIKENSLGIIRQSVDIEEGGNIAKVSGLTFKAINPEYSGADRFDQSFAGYNMENRDVEIRLVFWTGSNPAWSDTLLLFQGVVDDVSFDYGEYTIKVKDAGFKRHKNIPDLIIEKETYPNVPEYNIGKVVPLLFGTVSGGVFQLRTAFSPPAILIDKNKYIFLVSRNKASSININTQNAYCSDASVFAYIERVGVDQDFDATYSRPSKFAFKEGGRYQAGHATQLSRQGDRTSPTNLDYKNAVDDDGDTYFTLGASEKLYLYGKVPNFGLIIESMANLRLIIDFGTITGTGKMTYYNPDWDNGVGGYATGITFNSSDSDSSKVWDFTADKSAHGVDELQADQGNPWTIEELNTYLWGLECDAASSAQIKNIYLSCVDLPIKGTFIVRAYSIQGFPVPTGRYPQLRELAHADYLKEGDNICSKAQGVLFGSWVDADSRNSGYDEDDLIEYGAYPIEAILRDELGLTSNEINHETFDDVGNNTDGDRKDWKFASVISEEKNSLLEIIQEFCHECGIIYLQNYENKETIKVLKKQTAVKTIDRTSIQQNSIVVKFSDLKKVYNEFYLSYDKQWVNDVFRKTLFITASDHNLSSNVRSGTPNTFTGLCSDSQDKYFKTNRLTLDCDWIRDDATAELLIKWLAEWLCYRKYIVEFETAGLDHIDLELGDQVKIDHTLLPDGVSNDDSFFLYDISDDLNKDRERFKFMQVPDLLA